MLVPFFDNVIMMTSLK